MLRRYIGLSVGHDLIVHKVQSRVSVLTKRDLQRSLARFLHGWQGVIISRYAGGAHRTPAALSCLWQAAAVAVAGQGEFTLDAAGVAVHGTAVDLGDTVAQVNFEPFAAQIAARALQPDAAA